MSSENNDVVYGTEDLLMSLCNSVTRVLNVATQTKIHYSGMVQRITKIGLKPDIGCFVLFDGGFTGLVVLNFAGDAALEIYERYMLNMGMPKSELAGSHTSDEVANILGELMNQIDECEPNEQVLFIMNTNSLDRLERAVRNRPGRVDQIVQVPLPDAPTRARLLKLFAKNFAPNDATLEQVAAATEGATPATLKEIVKRAAVSAISRAGPGKGAAHAIQLRPEDLLLAYEQVRALRES